MLARALPPSAARSTRATRAAPSRCERHLALPDLSPCGHLQALRSSLVEVLLSLGSAGSLRHRAQKDLCDQMPLPCRQGRDLASQGARDLGRLGHTELGLRPGGLGAELRAAAGPAAMEPSSPTGLHVPSTWLCSSQHQN